MIAPARFAMFRCMSAPCVLLVLLSGLVGCGGNCLCRQTAGSIIAQGAQLVAVSTEFKFTEGPAVDGEGNVYFTDQPNDRIMIYTTAGKLETFMQPAGRSNGLYFDRNGELIACADEKNQLWRIDTKTKQHTVLAQDYADHRLNGPNDVWVHSGGGIYFTDPFYKRPWWEHNEKQQDGECVYYLSADLQKLIRAAEDLEKPNGIIGTADGKRLYVADIGAGKTYVYDIEQDGTLTHKKLFCQMGSDGMTIDCRGNVYLTGSGVSVFNPQGRQIEHIDVPQKWTANITFGGKNRKTLFITAGPAVYLLQTNVCGVK